MAKLREQRSHADKVCQDYLTVCWFLLRFCPCRRAKRPVRARRASSIRAERGETSPFNDKPGNSYPPRAVQKFGEHGDLQFLNFGWLYECADILAVMTITEFAYLLHLCRAWRASCFSVQTNCPSVIRQLRPSAETADRACPKVATSA